jgi:signal peptidase I
VAQRKRGMLREYTESVIVAVVIAVILRAFVISAYKIPTGSMIPTLKIGDCIFAWKLTYGVHVPFTHFTFLKPKSVERGSVVVFKYPEDPSISFVKRVIGVPGDKIEIRHKRVLVNDKILSYDKVDIHDPQTQDIPLRDMYIIQKEAIGLLKHYVMFKKGESDDAYGPMVIPDGKLFVLGDNRDTSDDSRAWGLVPFDNLEGRALLIWASFDWERQFHGSGFPEVRWERLFSFIH